MSSQIFKDKVVIITGSGSGIGKATAIELLKLGASVVLNGRNKEKLERAEHELKALGGKMIAVCCDLSIPEQAKELLTKTVDTFGKLDILINNAGVSMRGDFSDLDPGVFKMVFDANVLGVVNLTIPAMPYIKESKGSVIFISSLAGIRGLPGLSAYCSSKMALKAIAESIRIEEVNANIHVGLIQVGITELDPGKQIITSDGSLAELQKRSGKFQTTTTVAKAILKNIEKRKFITTLTGLGKLNAIMQPLVPSLVEKILIRSMTKIKKMEK